MIIDREAMQKPNEEGAIVITDLNDSMPLSDFWILGFFEVLRIVCSNDYKAVSEIDVDRRLMKLKRRANMVRSAFAKLQVVGKRDYIAPSHSGFGGERGVIYAVYNEQGEKIDISRCELADEFLGLMASLPPSKKFREKMSEALARNTPPVT